MKKIRNSAFIKDAIVTFSGQFVVLITNFIINKVVAIYVGVSQFGIFNIAKRSATVIGFIVLLELGISIPRYVAMYLHSDKKKAMSYFQTGIYMIIVTSIVGICIGFLFSEPVSRILFGTKSYQYLIMPMILFAVGTCINTFAFSAFRGAEYFYMYTIIQIFTQFVDMIAIFVFRNSGVKGILSAWGLTNIVLSIIVLVLFTKLNGVLFFNKIDSFFDRLKELLVYGVPRILGDIVQFSYYLLPLVFVNKMFGSNTAGYFSASTGILQSFLPFFSYIGIILLPTVSKALMNHDLKNVKKSVTSLMIIYFITSLLAVVVGFVFMKPIMIILYSSQYVNDLNIVKILLLTLIPRAQFLLLRNPIDAISVKPYNTINLIISMVIMIIIIMLSKSSLSIAWAFVISDGVLCILSFINWKQLIRKEMTD